VISY